MKKLSKILVQQGVEDGFPIRGVNGYAGEQDGTRVVLSEILHLASRREAEGVMVPDDARIHWATYLPGEGWEVVWGVWK